MKRFIIKLLISIFLLTVAFGSDGRGNCDEGYVEDCSGDGDCCLESWIGNGNADCEDQTSGCDLTCFDNDGGDCEDDNCPYVNGDATQDGIVNVLDIVAIVNHLYGIQPLSDLCSADYNNDNIVDVLDIVLIINCILGISECFE